ncbi:hypothetical protein [Brevundimonas naejangsanensis]|nr:hypothetical protein [Brevundimonas naejangsanensis]
MMIRFATALAGQFGDESDNKLARMNIEVMHSIILKLAMAAATSDGAEGEEGGKAVVLDAEVMFMSRSLQAEFKKEAIKKLDEAVQSGDAEAEAMRSQAHPVRLMAADRWADAGPLINFHPYQRRWLDDKSRFESCRAASARRRRRWRRR